MANGTSQSVKPKVRKRIPVKTGRKHLRPEEANQLIAAAGRRGRYPQRDRLMLRLVYRHGLRASELTGLRWDAIDLGGGTIAVTRVKSGLLSAHTLARDDVHALRKLKAQATGPWVFQTERGAQASTDVLTYVVAEAAKLAKLADDAPRNPHALRHGAGFNLINSGVDVRLVQDFLGHVDISSTMLYTQIAPHRLAAVRVR
jgi:type 1 fimbriae regulatory protein FimB